MMIHMMFKKALIDKILSGEKTATRRVRQQAKVGDVLNLMANKDYSKETGIYIEITRVYPQRLGDMTDEDAKKEGFPDLDHFKEYWIREIESSWDSDTVLWVHEFKTVKKTG
jgi:hypothetical protein